MKVMVTGASGFIGRSLVKALLARGDEVTVLSRHVQHAREVLGPQVSVYAWDPKQPGEWEQAIGGMDAVINLAGESVAGGRWTEAKKQRIFASRIDATRAVVEAIERASHRPAVLINASAIGYYGDRSDETLTEESEAGSDFLAQVVEGWEQAARVVERLGVRLVLIRTGVVLGPGGGALAQMAMPFRLFVGGTLGQKEQWVSWISLEDEIGLILYALDHPEVHGVLNATAPQPVTMETLSRQIGAALGRPSWVPGLGTGLKLALGEAAGPVLASQRVLPEKAQRLGYQFQQTDSGQAVRESLR